MSIKSVRDKAGDKKIDWLGVGLQALGRRQLTEIYSKLLPQLNKYNELAAQMDAELKRGVSNTRAAEIKAEADDRKINIQAISRELSRESR